MSSWSAYPSRGVWWLLAAPLAMLVLAGGWAKARGYRRGRTARRCHGVILNAGVPHAAPPARDEEDWFADVLGWPPGWFSDPAADRDDRSAA